jgi:hypothetical protein
VLTAYRTGSYSGIGFVFRKSDQLVGIDLDACRDPNTGDLTAWALEIVSSIQSYTEVSPSGFGVKIICGGSLPDDLSRNEIIPKGVPTFGPKEPEIAVFDDVRYFTITGNVFQGYTRIEKRQEEIDQLVNRYFIELSTHREDDSRVNDSVADVVERMLRIRMKDRSDGSRRLLAYCCRCVEADLSETDSLTAIRNVERLRPFPRKWSDDEILTRLKDAERKTTRGRKGPSGHKSRGASKNESSGKPSQATKLVALAANAELWHDADANGYATVNLGDHREHHPIRSKVFRLWLARGFYLTCASTPNAQAMHDALGVLEARARFEGVEHAVHLRVADHRDSIFIDLCDPLWRTVEVTANGWRIVADPPVRFRRAKGMMPLPIPFTGGSLETLRHFVNATDNDWPLVLAWLVAAVRPVGPYPVLCLHGEQGSAKSTSARALRRLVDPNKALIRVEPKEPRDLMIAANNGRVLAFDNLSHLPAWLSDALCRLSTGGGFSTRTLYENDEETIFDATRPVIVTGIEEVATRGDLIDRSLLLSLPAIPETQRRAESELWRDFEQVESMMLGALMSAVSAALRNLPTTKFETLPRMADFALWASAAEHGLSMPKGGFLLAYSGNRDNANELALESSPVAKEVIELAVEGEWSGTATDLLAALNLRAGYDESGGKSHGKRQPDGWPKGARGLSGTLKRLAPNLRRVGVDIQFWREPDRRRRKMLTIRTVPESCVRNVRFVQTSVKQGMSSDANTSFRTHERTQIRSEVATADYSDDVDAKSPDPSALNGWPHTPY